MLQSHLSNEHFFAQKIIKYVHLRDEKLNENTTGVHLKNYRCICQYLAFFRKY